MENNGIQEKQELISVIIPVYQVEKYLTRCLDSVINQTYKNLEIILVDDGSTDASGYICDEYAKKDNRIKVIHKENGGAARARNIGLDCAHGTYIGFVDSDDWIDRDMYEYLWHILESNNADISMCLLKKTGKRCESTVDKEKIKVLEHDDIDRFFYRLNGEESLYSICNRLYKKDVIKGIRFLEGRITEDVLYTYEAYKAVKRLVISNQKKYYYFMNETGVTRSGLCVKDLALLEIWDLIVKDTKGIFPYYEWALLNKKRAIFTLYAKGMRYGVKEDVDRKVFEEWKGILRREYKDLVKGKMLDVKRKILLMYIVISPTKRKKDV